MTCRYFLYQVRDIVCFLLHTLSLFYSFSHKPICLVIKPTLVFLNKVMTSEIIELATPETFQANHSNGHAIPLENSYNLNVAGIFVTVRNGACFL